MWQLSCHKQDSSGLYAELRGGEHCKPAALSLADEDVYQIPVLLVIGWRGEPGFADEPQHKKQGKVTLSLLEAMGHPLSGSQ